jgi:hypothetical protein
MRFPIDHKGAASADTFPAVMVKNHGLFPLFDKSLIEDIQHFQKGHIAFNVADGIIHQLAFGVTVFLAPNL